MKYLIILTFALTVLSACAGAAFKWSDVKRVQVGMTQQEVTGLLGKPTAVSAKNGGTLYVWTHVNGLTASVRTVSIPFDKDGKVIEVPPSAFDD